MGIRSGLFQEESTGSSNHNMYRLTDMLALGTALDKLDSTMTIEKLNAFVKAGSNKPAASIEGLLDALRKALAGAGAETLLPGNASDTGNSDPSRSLYHVALAALQVNPIFKDLSRKLLIHPTGKELAASARNDFGALIALQDLSPLYISGTTLAVQNQLTEIWQISRATHYIAWLADKSTATPTTFTEQWIADRAALLQAIVTRNKQDNTNGLVYDVAAPGDRALAFQFYETGTAQQQTLFFQRQGGAVAKEQRIIFGNSDANTIDGTANLLGDHLYGGASDDNINGNAGADYLEGNTGNDTLNGGDNDKASDTLIGGQGTDTYQFNGNNGRDFIIDSDGQGSIQIDGATLTGGAQYGDNRVYRSADKKHLYVLANDKTLLINGQIVVQGYDKARGDFGLNYTDAALQTNPNTSLHIKGDLKPQNFGTDESPRYELDPLTGNLIASTTAEADRRDTLDDSPGNDHITSGGGSDDIYLSKGGDNWVEAGTGRDWVRGGAGKDCSGLIKTDSPIGC